MHLAQFVQRTSMINISASFNSIASSGQTPTQHPQKSHLLGRISINSFPVFAWRYFISKFFIEFFKSRLNYNKMLKNKLKNYKSKVINLISAGTKELEAGYQNYFYIFLALFFN